MGNQPKKKRKMMQTTSDIHNQGGINMKIIWFTLGGVLVIALLAVVLANPSNPAVAREFGEVAVVGDNLPIYNSEAGPDVAIGAATATVTGENFDGTEVIIGGAQQDVQLIGIVAHWCPFCQQEVPKLVAYINQNGQPVQC